MLFKSVYIRLLFLMSITILLLLGSIETLTYVVFSRQLQADGQANLTRQVREAEDSLRDVRLHPRPPKSFRREDLSDDSGEDVYFLAVSPSGRALVSSGILPLTTKTLVGAARPFGFTNIEVHEVPYRVLAVPHDVGIEQDTLYIFQLTTREADTLREISSVLWIIGSSGGAGVILINLWLARRALAPARRTWKAQQEMLLELSHEMKTPLATIAAIAGNNTWNGDGDSVSASNRVSGEGAGAQQMADRNRRLWEEVRHASSLVDDILYLAQLRSVLDQTAEPIAVSDVTEETIGRFHPLAATQSMTLQGRAETGIYVMSTIERWSHLVSILLKNATQHGLPGTPIDWSLTATRDTVTLWIVNRVTPRRGNTKDGTRSGIGLRIGQRLVEDMRGQLTQTEENGKMTTTITVPRMLR